MEIHFGGYRRSFSTMRMKSIGRGISPGNDGRRGFRVGGHPLQFPADKRHAVLHERSGRLGDSRILAVRPPVRFPPCQVAAHRHPGAGRADLRIPGLPVCPGGGRARDRCHDRQLSPEGGSGSPAGSGHQDRRLGDHHRFRRVGRKGRSHCADRLGLCVHPGHAPENG